MQSGSCPLPPINACRPARPSGGSLVKIALALCQGHLPIRDHFSAIFTGGAYSSLETARIMATTDGFEIEPHATDTFLFRRVGEPHHEYEYRLTSERIELVKIVPAAAVAETRK